MIIWDSRRSKLTNLKSSSINETPGLRVLGNPMFNVIAFVSDDFHVFSLADKMKAKGWLLGCKQYPTW